MFWRDGAQERAQAGRIRTSLNFVSSSTCRGADAIAFRGDEASRRKKGKANSSQKSRSSGQPKEGDGSLTGERGGALQEQGWQAIWNGDDQR